MRSTFRVSPVFITRFFFIFTCFCVENANSAQLNASGIYAGAGAVNGTNKSATDNTSGVYGYATKTTGKVFGVYGRSNSNKGKGVYAYAWSPTGLTYGLYAVSKSSLGRGVYGRATSSAGKTIGVLGISSSTQGTGVLGLASAVSGVNYGVKGFSFSPQGYGVYGRNTAGGWAGYFKGKVKVTGGVTATLTGNVTGSVTGAVTGNLTGDVTGNATTATALAGNGGNCPAGNYPLGVDASGNVETCTAVSATADMLKSVYDTNGNSSADTADLATTATALSGNGTDCTAGNYPLGVDASGNVETCTAVSATADMLKSVYDTNGNSVVDTATALAGNGTNCTAGNYPLGVDASGNVETCTAIPAQSSDWTLAGNAGTVDGTNFIGTADNVAFDVRVNNARALRIEPATTPNIIGGYFTNNVTANVVGATIAGGGVNTFPNSVTDDYGFVGGGYNNRAGDIGGTTSNASWATVSGGVNNTASGSNAAVGGGSSNAASGGAATVGGGQSNTASGLRATVGGGLNNTASGSNAAVGGGSGNIASGVRSTVGGGQGNAASGQDSTVGGGFNNTASGLRATVSGGWKNTASGDYSWAGGLGASANGKAGAFVWSDGSAWNVTATAANQFTVQTGGGIRLYSSSNLSTSAILAAGSGAWAMTSDRNTKENFEPVDGKEVLDKLSAMELSSWNYKTQDDSVRHIGPMAQDFYSAYGTGLDDKHITTIDADGVALAAIKGLYDVVKEKEAKIADLQAKDIAKDSMMAEQSDMIEQQRKLIEMMESRLSALEKRMD